MVFLTRHEESIKARLCFAFQESWILFQSFHYNPLQALNLFELLLLLCTKSFLKFFGFPNLEKLCYFHSLLSFPKEGRTNRLNSFRVSLLPFPKERRTNHLNSFVSPFFLFKEFKKTQSENSFDSSLPLKQKISKN